MFRNNSASSNAAIEASCDASRTDALLLKLETSVADPGPTEIPSHHYLRTRKKLTRGGTYFPLGYPVRILSNSRDVLAAAGQSWDVFHPIFDREPIELLVEVTTDKTPCGILAPAPTHTVRGDLLLQVSDHRNFVVAELTGGRALCRVSAATVASSRYFRYHFLEAAALSMIGTLRVAPVHGACVRIDGKGILLCGDSGDGKSTLAFAGARAGWTYVSDDASYIPLDRTDRLVIGNCNQVRFRPSAAELFPELAGRPITPRAAGKPSIEVRTSEWPHIATADSAIVEHVIFLNRKCVETQALVPLRPSSVWPWFEQHLLLPDRVRHRQDAALGRLLGAAVHELRYQDLGWAIERINQLVLKGN